MKLLVQIVYKSELLLYYIEVHSQEEINSLVTITNNYDFVSLEALAYNVKNWYTSGTEEGYVKINQIPDIAFGMCSNNYPCEEVIIEKRIYEIENCCYTDNDCLESYKQQLIENKIELIFRSLIKESLPDTPNINKSWIVKPLIRARLPYP